MFHRKLMIADLTFLFVICTQGQREQRFVLLPERAAASIPIYEKGVAFSRKGWSPTQSDIDGLEASLSQISYLKVENWNSGIHIDHPERYFRQYMAVVRGGKKEIYINAFCENPPRDWATHLYVVLDGGSCFWQALYDPVTKKFSNLTVNGRA